MWENYFPQMVRLAAGKLQGVARRAADEEDVALSEFDSFCQGLQAGRFPQLADRHDLWRLLVVLTARKSADLAQHARRAKTRRWTRPRRFGWPPTSDRSSAGSKLSAANRRPNSVVRSASNWANCSPP